MSSIETTCAVCRLSDGLVMNTIVAVPSDPAPDGCQLVEIMTGLRLHEVADVRGRFLFIAIPPAAARVAMIVSSGCIGWQFDFRVGSRRHAGRGVFGFRHVAPQLA